MIPCNELIRGYDLYAEEYNNRAIEVLKSGYYVLGKQVSLFEEEFAKKLSDDCYCAGVDNGLNAIAMGLRAFDIGEGDEVIMQANGYIATTLGITHNGATPVFVDNDEYHNLDGDKLEAAITDKTKAVIVTHLYGQCTRMDKIVKICKDNNLLLFEDCAQGHFATYKGKCAGTFGDASFFSFYPTKNLGGFGDGGCVVSHSKEIIDKIKIMRNYGSDYRYHNIIEGYNSRLDEMQAGLLRVKLSHYDELTDNRRYIAKKYLEGMKNPLVTLPKIPDECEVIWYLFVVNVDDQAGFCKYLDDNSIGNAINFPMPPYMQPAMEYLGYKRGYCEISEHDCDTVVSLPMMDYMTDEEIDEVIKVVNAYQG